MLSSLISKIVMLCARKAWVVLALFTLFGAGAIFASATLLGVTTDTDKMFSSSLPWKKRNDELSKLFPQTDGTLVAVIRSDIPEQGRATARALAAALSRDHAHFTSVRLPDDNAFLTNHALLYLDKPKLETLLNSIIAAQPFLGTLAADPSARGLFSALGLIGEGIQTGNGMPDSFRPELEGFAKALHEAASGHPKDLSWQNLLAGQLSSLGTGYVFVIAKPILNYNMLQPGGAAAAAMHAVISQLPFVKSGNAVVMITGEVQLNDEEFATVANGMALGLITSLVLVALWLALAVHSPRVIFPILVTLVTGLLLTTGFAAVMVRTLNLISIAFAILFIGIAVDFAIQFCVRLRGQRLPDGRPMPLDDALARTGYETGHQILIAALATATGFLAFVPTNFVGVAQLGLIAGVGMLIAFLSTITLLPALLHLCRADLGKRAPGFARAAGLDHFLREHRRPVLAVFVILGLAGAGLVPTLGFDADPLHTKNPNSEGMRALALLEKDPRSSPYTADLLVPNLDVARTEAAKLASLPSVQMVLWLGSFVPDDQKDKLAMVADAASLLLPTLIVPQPAAPPDADALREAAKQAAAKLTPALAKLPPNDPLREITASLVMLSTAPDAAVLAANAALTRFLPEQLAELQRILRPTPVTLHSIPPEIAEQYALPDGRAKLSIYPKGHLSDNKVLGRFLREVQSVDPNAGGPALEIFESARTLVHAFTTAAVSALAMIAIILFAALRRLLDMALVMAPLVLSALLTVIMIVTIPETLNYANIIALPLLLGVGVSFNIYFVMNWRAGVRGPLTSPTARAVLFSALTTGTAFGSLAASHHPGTASMGRLLLISLGCTLIATLIFIPALLPKRDIDPE
ncbi:MMPL family transporter [Acidomonas methanolica]|uniref:MMPL family transporter n=1 Tax=Acidomonas methanolica TaxID=437 RepID=UPI002119BD2D|nr:MMPL family transporter [Acidomonas methanolica]MCQ9156204.1 MMPL family transporter [Acidomonas methanolica]